jgi:hypothetical protein
MPLNEYCAEMASDVELLALLAAFSNYAHTTANRVSGYGDGFHGPRAPEDMAQAQYAGGSLHGYSRANAQ